MSIIKIINLHKTYGSKQAEVKALRGLSLSVDSGDMVAIMGPSGSGKSTLLNIIGCIDAQTDGSYFLNGDNVSSFSNSQIARLRNECFGFVIQDFALVDRYNVYNNVMIPLSYSKKPIESKKDSIIKVLSQLGISEKIKSMASDLSIGQRQRVAIARAIVNDPDILLADEPTGSLDSKTGKEVMSIFKQLNKKGKTIILVTHDETVALDCKKIVKIEDGRIIN